MTRRRTSQRLLAATRLLTAAALLAGITVTSMTPATPAAASGTSFIVGNTNFTVQRSFNTAGDMTVIGNSNMSCNGETTGCAAARNGTGKVNNNDWPMVWVDVDNDGDTVNSSSADLTMPPGSTVLWAGLYWSGIRPTGTRVAPPTSQQVTAKFKTPGATAYETITAERFYLPSNTGDVYSAVAEVTNLVAAGGEGTYFVADLWSFPNPKGTFAGWSLVVIYANQNQPSRSLTVFEGYRTISGSQSAEIAVSGFRTPLAPNPVNTRVGFMASEGDLGATGDFLQVNGQSLSVGTIRPDNNFFNSSITTATDRFTARNPNFVNTLGFDTGMATVPDGAIGNDATSATLKTQTFGDRYDIVMLAFATDLYAPKFDQSITVTNPDGTAWSGEAEVDDTLSVTLSATVATDGSNGTSLSARVPTGLNIDTDSITVTLPDGTIIGLADSRVTLSDGLLSVDLGNLAIGAQVSVSFDLTVPQVAAGTVPTLDFTINGTGATSEVAVTQTSEQVRIPIAANTADLSAKLTWVDAEPTIPGPVVTAGEPARFNVDIRNNGPLAAPAEVTLTLPAGATYSEATGTGWSCGSVSGTTLICQHAANIPANSVAAPLAIDLDVPATAVDNSTLDAQAEVAIGAGAAGITDPASGNNTSSSTATIRSKTDLGVSIARSGSTAVGANAIYTVTATNLGPSVASATANSAVVVTTTLPDNLAFVSASGMGWTCTETSRVVTCTRTSLDVGETSPPITITTQVESADTILVRTEVTGGGIDRNLENNRALNSSVGTLRAKLIESVNNGVPLVLDGSTPTDATIRAYNAGPSPVPTGTEITHTMEIPRGVEFVELSTPNGWTCDPSSGVGILSVECTRTLTAPWTAGSELPEMVMSLRAKDPTDTQKILLGTVSTDLDSLILDPSGATAQTDLLINDAADLAVTGTPAVEITSSDPAPSISYVVTNEGDSTDPGPITVTLSAPDGLAMTPPNTGPWSCEATGPLMTCTLEQSLEVDASTPPLDATLRRSGGTVPRPNDVMVVVTSPFSDPDPANNATATQVAFRSGPDSPGGGDDGGTDSGNGFVPIPPARPIDTRPSAGGDGPVPGGSVLEVDLSDLLDTTRALGAVINITAVDDLGTVPRDGRVGFITAYPCGQEQPAVSNVNYIAGDISSNTSITRIGDGGKVCLFVSDTVNVLVDITGWFSQGYFGGAPQRLLETRGPGGIAQPIPAGTVTRVPVAGRFGVPSSAVGAALNVTASNPSAQGFITVWDCDSPRPNTSNVNFSRVTPFWAVANFTINELSSTGEICVYNSVATDVLVDVFGWFDGTFRPIPNARLLDTRSTAPLAGDQVVRVQITGRDGVPASAKSVAVNVTAVDARSAGFATVYACEANRPNVSKINFFAGETVANTTFIGLDSGGGLCIYTSGTADYLMDVFGWFTTGVIRN